MDARSFCQIRFSRKLSRRSASISVSGTTITVTAKATGSATITVNVGADTNYTAPSSKTFTVAVTLVSKTLSSNSWAVIKAVSDAGQGANYWSVGATKSVTINGKVGATTISSLKVDAFTPAPPTRSSFCRPSAGVAPGMQTVQPRRCSSGCWD